MGRWYIKLLFLFVGLLFNSTSTLLAEDQVSKIKTTLRLNENDNNLEFNYNTSKIVLKGRSEGIRHKKFAMFNINVYKAKLFFPDSMSSIKNADKLLTSDSIAIKIHPLRSFAGDKLKEAMTVSYEANKINFKSKHQQEFLDLISKNQIEKDSPVFLIGLVQKDKEELHLIMNNSGEVIRGSSGFITEVFSVWLGSPVDPDMLKLKEVLMN